VLIDDGSARRFGPALAWARQAGVSRLHVLVEGAEAAGVVARRARAFVPASSVWLVDGRSVVPAAPAPIEPFAGAPAWSALAEVVRRHGCDAVVEHGELIGSVLGLEVARVIDGELAVGVGRHDRIARASMRPGEDAGAALEEAAAAVRLWRRLGVARHPANTLQRSRWLRSVVCTSPALVGAAWLEPAAPALPSLGLTDNSAVPCVGPDIVAVCSVGIDLDLIPTAADCRLVHGPSSRLVIVTPAGDDVAVNRGLLDDLGAPARLVTVSRGWEGLAVGSTPASRPSANT
jgi:hypothetical protein